MNRFSRSLTASTLLLMLGLTALAAESDGPAAKPSAAELVEGIIAQEHKIDSVQSLYLRFEGKWTNTPEAIAPKQRNSKNSSPERRSTLPNTATCGPK